MRLPIVLATIVLTSIPTGLVQAQTTHTCFGEPATVVGTPGDDRLDGEVVVGLAGEDNLAGFFVCGGKGDDEYLSGHQVDGGPGNDQEIQLYGDLAIGGPGSDRFFDRNLADQPRQVWRGGEGNDVLELTRGEDVFYGGLGNDWTKQSDHRSNSKTRQFGGEGNDQLEGGFLRDKLYGEAGDDTLISDGFRTDAISDLLDGGEGFDVCILDPGDRALNCEDVTVVS